MIFLIGSIVLTSYLILSFKVLERLNIPSLQAIVINYMVCVITGSVVNGSFPINRQNMHEPWFGWALLMGTLFISLIILIAYTTQKISVAVTSVANKLSLVIPFVFSLYLYNEKASAMKIAGIIIALVAVVLTCLPAKKSEGAAPRNLSPALYIILPTILFFGSGLLDTLVKYVEQNYLDATNHDAYLIVGFATAAVIGSLLLIGLLVTGKQKFDARSILAGIIIGVPNYFSIWCLLFVLKQHQGNSSAIIPVNNMGIVLFSAVMAWLLFKERLSTINWIGIILSLGAIALIAFA